MKKGDLLFVYGTLRKGERADLSKSQGHFNTCYVGNDSINGLLYHLGAYPGLKLLSEESEEDFNPAFPSVLGEVFIIQDSSAAAILDAYEGYDANDPKCGLYDRTKILTKAGRLVWVYVYNHYISEDQLIETGDWKNPRLVVTKRVPNLGRN